jgi:hypothetical protein
MPSEYEALVAALKLTSYPVAEYGWKTRPEGAYLTTSLDFESGTLTGCGEKLDRSWSGSVDAFFPKLTDRDDVIETVEEILSEIFGDSWGMNSLQYENTTGLFHIEWTFDAVDTEPEPEPEPEPEDPGDDNPDDPGGDDTGEDDPQDDTETDPDTGGDG